MQTTSHRLHLLQCSGALQRGSAPKALTGIWSFDTGSSRVECYLCSDVMPFDYKECLFASYKPVKSDVSHNRLLFTALNFTTTTCYYWTNHRSLWCLKRGALCGSVILPTICRTASSCFSIFFFWDLKEVFLIPLVPYSRYNIFYSIWSVLQLKP